jgi:hypothetical protein
VTKGIVDADGLTLAAFTYQWQQSLDGWLPTCALVSPG